MKGGLQLVTEGGEKMMRTKAKRAVQVTSISLALIVSAAFLPTLANGSIATVPLVDFGNVVIGSSKTITLKITNTTDNSMRLGMTWSCESSCASFSLSSSILSIGGRETVDLGVTYEALSLGSCEATLIFYILGTSDTVKVPLTGKGVEEGEPDDPTGTIVIHGRDTGVLDQQYNGSSISALIEECASEIKNHGAYVSCVAKLTNELKKAGIISGQEKDAIQSCAAQASIP